MKGVATWRVAAAILVLAALALFAAELAPIYVRGFELRRYVSGLTHSVESGNRSDDTLRALVLAKARNLNLPVTAAGVQISHEGELRIDVRYEVKVDFPGYAVELHF